MTNPDTIAVIVGEMREWTDELYQGGAQVHSWADRLVALGDVEKDAARFREACERAAAELPDGWEVRILIERGAAIVDLWKPDGNILSMDVDSDDRLTAEVNAAVDYATSQDRTDG